MFKTTSKSRTSPGKKMYSLVEEMYPICRSITGNGVRKTLDIISGQLPIEVFEVPTGTQVFDWSVPKEWNIKDAWIKKSNGEKIVDFNESNLHVLNYSLPVNQKISLKELQDHIYTLPEQPDKVPYRTSYYKEKWGFCMAHNVLIQLEEGMYQVYIDSSLQAGSLTYGELYIPGESTDEVLITSHICHPSLANDNLSGITVAVHLAQSLQSQTNTHSYRFLFIPGTIGSITWLARNESKINNIKYGLVLSCVGDAGHITYKKSRQAKAEIDRIVEQVLTEAGEKHEIRDFIPYGYDERQFCSPAFDLPVGCFMRSPFGEFPEYHTSADNLDFVEEEALANSLRRLKDIVHIIEHNDTFLNLNPKCEPNLGKRGLYKLTGGDAQNEINQLAILWVLNLSDGRHSLLDIAERADMSFETIKKAADALLKVKLLEKSKQSIPIN